MSSMVRCDWCRVITVCEQGDIDEWVCPECCADHLETVRALYDPDDGPIAEEEDGGGQGGRRYDPARP